MRFLVLVLALALLGAGPICDPAEEYAEGYVIVKAKPGRGAEMRSAQARVNAKDHRDLGRGRKLWKLPPGLVTKTAVQRLQDHPAIEYAEPDYVLSIAATPNDPLWERFQYGPKLMQCEEAWDLTIGSQDVVVAVIDTGVDYTHPDIAANIIGPGKDFFGGDDDAMDDNGHGTHVAGTICAVGNNGQAVAGVAWSCRVLPVKFLNCCGSGFSSDAIPSIEYAIAQGADIINASWGSSGFSQALSDSINGACDAGALFVAAAGNAGRDTDVTPYYPQGYDAPCIISVAATGYSDDLASFSNRGIESVDVAAPGRYVYSLGAPLGGSQCKQPSFETRVLSGTSMAAPHVAGVAVLVEAMNPGADWPFVKDAILNGVDIVPGLNGEVATGGRVNAYKAIGAAPPDPNTPSDPVSYCGDGFCNGSESCRWCRADCVKARRGVCCGDGKRKGDETFALCDGRY